MTASRPTPILDFTDCFTVTGSEGLLNRPCHAMLKSELFPNSLSNILLSVRLDALTPAASEGEPGEVKIQGLPETVSKKKKVGVWAWG